MFATLKLLILHIAEVIGKSEWTIENWIIKYINEVLEGISSYKYKQKKQYLSHHQINQIKIFVTFDNPERIKEIIHYINDKFNVKYSIEGARKILM